ncbi:MAG TPA: CDP-diacylglycerol--glycerol-3-phosphate 3-phosphatidyltransferase [Phycisphaerae bacterium]|nr:CDP-diacylglycerol--glycerol-3-phosphate 3-phosphatidyltransferase [Phycisphaerae bacterium]
MKINLPNQITLARLGLAIIFFILLSLFRAEDLESSRWMLWVSFWIFLVAALTDILDGFLARMMKQVTSFGRIVDPVVDKVMVCGAFIFFASEHFWAGGRNISGVAPWMVIVVLLRELLVSAIRSHSEGLGQDFAATWAGKLKMFVQSATVCVVLGQLAWFHQRRPDELAWIRVGSIWLMLVVTTLSMVMYIRRAYSFLLSSAALGAGSAAQESPTTTTEKPGPPPTDAPPNGDAGGAAD